MKIHSLKRAYPSLLSSGPPEVPPIDEVEEVPYDDTALVRAHFVMQALKLENLPVKGLVMGRRAYLSCCAYKLSSRPDTMEFTGLSDHDLTGLLGVPIALDPFADDDAVHATTGFVGQSRVGQVRRYAGEQSKAPWRPF
jgi:hypothetical protein